jgi:nucleoid-associated protein YgaU
MLWEAQNKMADRNIKRPIVKNDHPGYSDLLEKRGLTSIRQYGKLNLSSITDQDRQQLSPITHLYKTGDKLYKLAHEYYGDTRYWWIIAWYNRKPTDFHYNLGDTVYIPFPLKEALYLATKEE